MAVFRISKNKNNPYVMVNKGFVLDVCLSAKAKGILLYLLSRPDDWKVYESEIPRHFKDGLKSVRSGVKELLQAGYLSRRRMHAPNGSFAGFEYTVYESPKTHAESTIMPKRNNAKGQATNNYVTNNDEIINLTDDELKHLESKHASYEEWLEMLNLQINGTIN